MPDLPSVEDVSQASPRTPRTRATSAKRERAVAAAPAAAGGAVGPVRGRAGNIHTPPREVSGPNPVDPPSKMPNWQAGAGLGELRTVEPVIYLDNSASTPIDPRVLDVMLPVLVDVYANPSSTTHGGGRQAAALLERARSDVAALVGAMDEEIIFTGGATESNNLAILGIAPAAPPTRRRVLATVLEHKSVLGPVRELERRGFSSSLIGVDRLGRIDVDELESRLRQGDVFLVSVQAANSEIGTRQDIAELARLAHEYGAIVHCDAVQAAGKVPVDVASLGVDLMSFNAHKLYGPKGAGALFLRGGASTWPLQPLMFGGSQEHGLRPGTLNTPAIVGFGAAAAVAIEELEEEADRVSRLRDLFEEELSRLLDNVVVNGDREFRLPGSTSVSISGVDAEALLARVPKVSASTTSACNAGALEPSHVLLALGLSRKEAYETVRLTFGRFGRLEEVQDAARIFAEAGQEVRRLA
jgi:cysteine desulfurase